MGVIEFVIEWYAQNGDCHADTFMIVMRQSVAPSSDELAMLHPGILRCDIDIRMVRNYCHVGGVPKTEVLYVADDSFSSRLSSICYQPGWFFL